MATLVVRHVDAALHARLKRQAAAHRRSMEEEVRQILRQGVATEQPARSPGFGQAMRAIFEPLGGFDLPNVPREPPREPPDFSGPDWDSRN